MAFSGYKALKILVVDDFDSFRMTICRILQEMGARKVDTAVNGAEALRMCAEVEYDLVLCDYNLGSGRNGLQVLEFLSFKKMRKLNNLFILVSAESAKNIVLAASDYEPDGYLTKPLTAKALQQRLDRLLHQREALKPIHQAIESNLWDRAIALCQTSIDMGSRYASVCQKLLGDLYLKTAQYELAEQVYRQVLEVRELDWAQVGMAKVRRRQGDLEQAVDWLQDIVEQSPMCMQAYDELAECMGKLELHEEQQQWLQRAVEISPLAVLRQEQLSRVAQKNNDRVVTAQTLRKVVKLSANSVHDKLENHLDFSRAAAAVFSENASVGRDLMRDALKTLDKMEVNFDSDDQHKVQKQLIESQLQCHHGNQKRATELLQDSSQIMESMESVEIDTELDRVRAMQTLGQKDKAKMVLKELVVAFQDDQTALQKIDQLLDEPVSEESRQMVAAINKTGIELYEKKSFLKAIECFKRAKRLFPMHVGVQLNLTQALIGQLKTGDLAEEWVEEANGSMEAVAASISAGEPQYQRYQQLQGMLRDIQRELK